MAKNWCNVRITQETVERLEKVRQSMQVTQDRDGRYPIREHGREDGAISWDTVIGVLLSRDERHRKASRQPRAKKATKAKSGGFLVVVPQPPSAEDHVYMMSSGG